MGCGVGRGGVEEIRGRGRGQRRARKSRRTVGGRQRWKWEVKWDVELVDSGMAKLDNTKLENKGNEGEGRGGAAEGQKVVAGG